MTEPAPLSAVAYFDTVCAWLPRPARQAGLAELSLSCSHLHVRTRSARFSKKYRQRIDLKQPTSEAIRWLSRRSALINRVEVAVDYAFASAAERERAYDFLHQHATRRWHGQQQRVFIHPGARQTRYDAGRHSANSMVFYREPHSRMTGEVDVIHFEWRLNRLKAVCSAGISSARHMLTFDHRAFWQKRLRLLDVSEERLGRLWRNSASGRRRQKPDPQDARYGHLLIGCVRTEHGWAVQDLIDEFRLPWFRLEYALQPLSIEAWLPPAAHTSCSIPSQTTVVGPGS